MDNNKANNNSKKISLIAQTLDALEKKYASNEITGDTYVKSITFSDNKAINSRIHTMFFREFSEYFSVNDLLNHYKKNNNRIRIPEIGPKSIAPIEAFLKEFQAGISTKPDTLKELIIEKFKLEQDLITLEELIQQLSSLSTSRSKLIEEYKNMRTENDKQNLIEMINGINAENYSSILLQRSRALIRELNEKKESLIYRFTNCLIPDGGDSSERYQ